MLYSPTRGPKEPEVPAVLELAAVADAEHWTTDLSAHKYFDRSVSEDPPNSDGRPTEGSCL